MNNSIRKGCKDVWNAYMVKDAVFDERDIPFCPTTATSLPTDMISWDLAKSIYKKMIQKKRYDFKYPAYVCFYIDDYKFDGKSGIWYNAKNVLKVLEHFEGIITPDFSTYQDFPEPIKLYNTYRMRAFGYWAGKNKIPVINNVRWGTSETYSYCFNGIETNSIVAIGTCGGSPRKLRDRSRFENGLNELVKKLNPKVILVYGSSHYPCFNQLTKQNIKIVFYRSQTSRAFGGGHHE